MNNVNYKKLVKKYTPSEDILKNNITAFIFGGLIGVLSTVIYQILLNINFDSKTSLTIVLLIIIFLSSLLTGLSIYDDIVSKLKCALIIPISGFAHSMTSATLDSKRDGLIKGIGSSMFKLSGSVIIYGVVISFFLCIIKVIING